MAEIRFFLMRCLLVLLMLGGGPALATPRVLMVLSKPDGAHLQTAEAARKHLAARSDDKNMDLTVQTLDEFRPLLTQARPPTLIVTVGVDAARRVAQENLPSPALYTLLPRSAALDILRDGRGKGAQARDSAIFLDQPLARQLDLLRLALPTRKRVGVILGPATRALAPSLHAAGNARALKMEIVELENPAELLPALDDLLDNTDILLSVPDAAIYNSETIHHILLTTYRHKVPVIGLSKAYVDAGALLAVYSLPDQIGREIADVLENLRGSGPVTLPTPDYPEYFLVTVNRRVAASLDIHLDSDMVLQRRLDVLQRP